MQIEPQGTAFAKRYARGETQVVWTTLVSDLETPVSAFLKIADGRPMSYVSGPLGLVTKALMCRRSGVVFVGTGPT